MQKFNVWFLVSRHWRAVSRSPSSRVFQPIVTAVYVLLPLLAGGGWYRLRTKHAQLEEVLDSAAILAAVAILIGFLFALVTWIFQLRRDYSPSHWLPSTDAEIPELLDQSFASACYGVLVSGTISLLAVPALAGTGGIAPYFEAVLVALIMHLALTLLMLVRRLAIAYDKLADEKDDERKAIRDQASSRKLAR